TAAMRTANEAAIRFIESGETIAPLGMTRAIFTKWRNQQRDLRADQLRLEERTAAILSASRALRLSLQVLMLGVGAFRVLAGELTAGAMIAASIIMGRALAPIERSIGGWRRFVAARAAYRNLKGLLAAGANATAEAVKLPRPAGRLAVENV